MKENENCETSFAQDDESLCDIIAEIYKMYADGDYCLHADSPLLCMLNPRKLARRLDRARMRMEIESANERRNLTALREALELCVKEKCEKCRDDLAMHGNHSQCISGCEMVNRAKAALSAPPRNCDVGTAAEQVERFNLQCFYHHTGRCSRNCKLTPSKSYFECALKWAQMPYEKGDTK